VSSGQQANPAESATGWETGVGSTALGEQFEARLNWDVWGKTVSQLILELLHPSEQRSGEESTVGR
jgi:hypothetical protein